VRWLLVLCVLAGCPWAAPVPIARVQLGPAHREAITVLAALPVQCTADPSLFTPAHAAVVASATRMALEFSGYSVVDSELINAELRRRSTRTIPSGGGFAHAAPARGGFGPPASGTYTETEITGGATWAEVSPARQDALLAVIGVQGLLRTIVTLGRARGLASQRTVTVSVEVSRLADARLAWHTDCSVETGDYHSTEQALDLATRCALDSRALW
jgi:hypothetical protein